MGNIYDIFKFSWMKEATFRDRPDAIHTGTGTTTYLFGEQHDTWNTPSPEATINEIPIYSSWDVSSLSQDKLEVAGDFEFTVKNGIELYYALGACSTTTGSAPFTHTITGINSGSLPSRTFHAEFDGGAQGFFYDVQGIKTSALMLTCGVGERAGNLTARVSYIGCKLVDSVADTNPAVEQTGVIPALPATANNVPFRMGPSASNVQWDSTDVVSLMHFNYTVTNLLMPRWENPNGNDEYGKLEKRWAQHIHELGVRRHRMMLSLYQVDQDLWNDFMDQLSKSFVIKFERGANDYIQLTAANSKLQAHLITQPVPGVKPLYIIVIQPTTVAIEVKDAIGIAAYEVS